MAADLTWLEATLAREAIWQGKWRYSGPRMEPSGPEATHPSQPNPCGSEYDHFGACRTVSEAIGGLGRASPQGADAGEPLAIFFALLGFFGPFFDIFRCSKSEIRNEESEIMCVRVVFGRNDSSRVHFDTFSLFNIDNIALMFRFPTPTYTYRSDSNIIPPSIA